MYIWRQHTPAAQLVSLYQRMWGDFDNFEEGVIGKFQFIERQHASLAEMEELVKYAGLPAWPTGARSSESL